MTVFIFDLLKLCFWTPFRSSPSQLISLATQSLTISSIHLTTTSFRDFPPMLWMTETKLLRFSSLSKHCSKSNNFAMVSNGKISSKAVLLGVETLLLPLIKKSISFDCSLNLSSISSVTAFPEAPGSPAITNDNI